MTEQTKLSPHDLLPELLEELEDLRLKVASGSQSDTVLTEEWVAPLMGPSPDFLRKLADFREGVAEAVERYPREVWDELESPDLDDPDLVAWHSLNDWFIREMREARKGYG